MRFRSMITLVLLLINAPVLASDRQKAETADDVIARYVQALGGEAAISVNEFRHMQGTFDQNGMVGRIDVYNASQNRYRMKLVIDSVGEFEEGVMDSVGWTHDGMSGPQLMTGNHLVSTLMRSRHNSELHYREQYREMDLEGEVEFDGVPCYKLRIETPWGSLYEFFDVETGLLRGAQGDQPISGDTSVPITLVVQEYTEFDGRLYPTKTLQSLPMGSQVIVIEQIRHGGLDPEVFQPPQPVLALLKAGSTPG